MLAPVIEKIAAQNPDIKVGKVNVDEEMELARQFNVMSIPTLAVFKNGKLESISAGVQPKAQIEAMLRR